MLKAYFDESGIHGGSTVTALAGFVAPKDAWEKLQPKWQSGLAEYADRGVRWFRMSEALAQEGQFARTDKPNLNYMLTQLSETLGESGATPILSAVVVKDWDAVVRFNVSKKQVTYKWKGSEQKRDAGSIRAVDGC